MATFPDVRRFGTYSVQGGFNVNPGLALEQIKQRQREDAARRAEFATQQSRIGEQSAADRALRMRAQTFGEDEAMFYRGLKGKELDDAIASRAEAKAAKADALKYSRSQDQAQGQRADRELNLREQQQAGITQRFDAAEQQRQIEQQADVQAEEMVRNATADYGDNGRDDDATWEANVSKALFGQIQDPDAPGAMALKRALTRKIAEAAEQRAAQRKEQDREAKESAKAQDAEAKTAAATQKEEETRQLAAIDDELDEAESEYNSLRAFASASPDMVSEEARNEAKAALSAARERVQELRQKRRELILKPIRDRQQREYQQTQEREYRARFE